MLRKFRNKLACTLLIGAFCILSVDIAKAEESSEDIEREDNFSKATEDYLKDKIKKKIRQDLAKKSLDKIGSKTLDKLAKKVPGLLYKRLHPIMVVVEGIRLAVTPSTTNEGHDIINRNIKEALSKNPNAKLPDPNSVPDVVRYVFEASGCETSEELLYDQLSVRFGISVANNTIANLVTNYPVSLISHKPHTFRYNAGEFCSKGRTGKNKPVSKAVKLLINNTINEGCEGRAGSMAENGIFIRDLDGDKKDDLILSHDGLKCRGAMQRSIYCGAQVCSGQIYLRRGGQFSPITSFHGTVGAISNDNVPTITIYQHGGRAMSVRWSGQKFTAN